MRVPGIGLTTVRYFRDKLAMRMRALDRHVRVPDFVPIVNHEDIRYYLDHVPGPWVLKPRQEASAIGIKESTHPQNCGRFSSSCRTSSPPTFSKNSFRERISRGLGGIGKRGRLRECQWYGKPPMNVAQGGGILTTFTVPGAARMTPPCGHQP